MQIHLPPLKERDGDVEELATLFMKKLSAQLGMPAVADRRHGRAALATYDWPGNVRELRNLIERTLILGAFSGRFRRAASAGQPAGAEGLADLERRHILAVLKAGGQRDEAARRLGISRKTIDRKCALGMAEQASSMYGRRAGALFASGCWPSRCCPCWSSCRCCSASPSIAGTRGSTPP